MNIVDANSGSEDTRWDVNQQLSTLALGDERIYVEQKQFNRVKAIFNLQTLHDGDGRVPSYGERIWNWCYHSEYASLWSGTRMKLGLFPCLTICKISSKSRAPRETEVVHRFNQLLGEGKGTAEAVRQIQQEKQYKNEDNVYQHLSNYEKRKRPEFISIVPNDQAEFEILKDYVIKNFPNQLTRNNIQLPG